MRMKTVLAVSLLVATLVTSGCNPLVMYPKAGEFLRQSDVEAVFGTPMRLNYDLRDKYHSNVSSCAYSGKATDGMPVKLTLQLAYCDAEALASAETAWRYGKHFPVEPPGLTTLPGIGDSAWIVP